MSFSPSRLYFWGWASLELLAAWVLVRWTPFRRVAGQLGKSGTVGEAPSPASLPAIADVAWAIGAATRRAPIKFTCLMHALAAQRMLRKRRIPATVYLAMSVDASSETPLAAHAWVRCGGYVVVGACDESQYRVIATFA